MRLTKGQTHQGVDVPEVGVVDAWTELVAVAGPLVSFRSRTRFSFDGAELVSDSRLRFRTRGEVTDALEAQGLVVTEVREAPDRPGHEMVFLARRTGPS